MVENFRDTLDLNNRLREEVAELTEMAKSAKEQLEEVLGAQEYIAEEKSQALAMLEEEKAEKKNIEASLVHTSDALAGVKDEFAKFRGEAAAQTEEAVHKALMEFKSSKEFQLMMEKAILDFQASSRFRDILFEESAMYFSQGFYSCRNWISSVHPEVPLDHFVCCTIANKFNFYPEGIDEEEEKAGLGRGKGAPRHRG
ncbi:hypothetical protein CFOL_v3_34635 [Cephalotus follicularis]|uniref:Uncharacterized protein n=1 Tax=Cephalotus follicularis TaxID=3775 RepID=A0A1Q3DFC5_CEPFO|nr:hypothetical protein CFOL_v3_34635 [Cephalotus follicularis]